MGAPVASLRPRKIAVNASLGQHARSSHSTRPRASKVVGAGGTVNFVDVAEEQDLWAGTSDSIYFETQINRQQRVVARQLSAILQVPTRVAVSVAAQESYLTRYVSNVLSVTVRALADYFGISCTTLGKILTLRPDFIAKPQLLQAKIAQASRVLQVHQPNFSALLSRAPELVAYSPEYLRSELCAVAEVLDVDIYDAAAVVQQEPRILTDGAQQLSERLKHLSSALSFSYSTAAHLVSLTPNVLYTNMMRLEKKRRFLEEACSSHPSWLQQLSDMSTMDLVDVLQSNGVPVFMRLRFLANLREQPHVNLLDTLTLPTSEFELRWPSFVPWAEWNTPSYLFE